jgi:hypothetical protein
MWAERRIANVKPGGTYHHAVELHLPNNYKADNGHRLLRRAHNAVFVW